MAKKKTEEKVEVKAEEVKEVKEPKEEAPPEKPGKPHHQHRLQALNEIAQSNREERDAALAENEPSVEEDLAAANEAAREAEETPAAPEVPEKPKRKFVVDGKDVELTEEQIVEYVQKSATVDQRMREATALLEDAKKRALPTPEQHSRPLPVPPDAGKADELVSKLTKAVLQGTEEEIAQAFKEAIGGRQTNQLTPEQVQALTLETIAFNEAKRLLDESPERGGFNDIFSDPILKAQFQRREDELRDAGDKRPYRELYSAIGTEIRKWRDDFVTKHAPKTGLEDRDAAKRQTGVVRGAGGKLPAPPEVRAKSHDEKLEAMRRARGLN